MTTTALSGLGLYQVQLENDCNLAKTTNENKFVGVDQEEEEEYGECVSGDVSSVDANIANVENVNADNEDEEEEYGECMSGDVSNVDANIAKDENVNAADAANEEEEEEYGECMSGTEIPVVVKQEQTELCHNIKREQTEDSNAIFNCPDNFSFSAPNSVESNFDSDNLDHFPSPKKEPGLCTPTSSGYWSDDAKVIIWSDNTEGSQKNATI